MNKIKIDKDLVFSILLTEIIGFIPLIILGILSLISWWLVVYVLCISLLIPVYHIIIKNYKEYQNSFIEFYE